MKLFSVFSCLVLWSISILNGQNKGYTGTFMTPDGTVTLQLKSMGSELHGVLVSAESMFALKAKSEASTIAGTVFTNAGNYGFSGKSIQGGLSLVSEGVTYTFYQTSTQHELDAIDLTPYFMGQEPVSDKAETDNAKNTTQYSG